MIKSYPADLITGTLGIKLPSNAINNKSRTGLFNLSKTTEDQSVSNYINLLLTKKGERYMQPNFGVGLYWYIFENNTSSLQSELRSEIEEQASIWLPYIYNKSIVIQNYQTEQTDIYHGLNIIITFSVTENGANRTISFFPGIKNAINVDIL